MCRSTPRRRAQHSLLAIHATFSHVQHAATKREDPAIHLRADPVGIPEQDEIRGIGAQIDKRASEGEH